MTIAANEPNVTTTIELLGKPYHIRCQQQEAVNLQQAAQYLNHTLEQLANNSKELSAERLAITAALNLAAKVISLEQQQDYKLYQLQTKISKLQQTIEQALAAS
jgi:cell division protein ZapA